MKKELIVNEKAKLVLKSIESLVDSKCKYEKIPSLLIVAEEGCGASQYEEEYSHIIDKIENGNGNRVTMLKLVFPNNNVENEMLFYSSCDRLARVKNHRNKFWGTMVISFEEYKGRDLLRSESFGRLLDFIKENKNNVHFVFRVFPSFDCVSHLLFRLREVININEVMLDKPGHEDSYEYLISTLESKGYVVDKKAQKRLKERVVPEIVALDEYKGYKTINYVLDRLDNEMTMSNMGKNVVGEKVIDTVISRFEEESRFEMAGKVKMGFGN